MTRPRFIGGRWGEPVGALLLVLLVLLVGCGGEASDHGLQDTPAGGPDVAERADLGAPSDGTVDGRDEDGRDEDGRDKPDLSLRPDVVVEPVCHEPPGGFGCDCRSNEDCDSGYCVPWDEGFVCTETCLIDCPEGWDCRGLPQLVPDVVFVCWPGGSHLCHPCAGDDSCGGGRCLALDDGPRCSRPCDTADRPCPAGYTCASVGASGDAEPTQCVPTSNACDCGPWIEEARRLRPCRNETASGTCWGEQSCDPVSGWSACTAAVPAEESCDGDDDDCDGVVDDVVGRGEACTTENGFGSCEGVYDCPADGGALACTARTPAVETCNGRDDDCDGATDEDFPGLGTVCTAGTGACERVGVTVCAGAGVACSAEAGAAGTEICNGRDDDCDGATDEELDAPDCALREGLCAGATSACGGTRGWLTCDAGRYPAGYEAVEASCDGNDNDCDGLTDEVDGDGDGHRPLACGGDDCDDTNPLAYPGAAEICGDGADNDCSGLAEDRDADIDGVVAVACGGTDCNDDSAAVRPGLDELCGDSLDNDCDGSIDNRDLDGDGFIARDCGGDDCDDTKQDVHPRAEERCDSLDDDCDGATDNKDLDGDGFIDADPVCGGEDCDDAREDVNPDGVEICGNDIDEDCSGTRDDRDLDADGAIDDDPLCGGDDCDDGDSRARPGAVESYDLLDNDCNGEVDEGLIPPGSVLVSEVMAAPRAAAGVAGQWIELYNAWHLPVNLRGWTIVGGDGAAAPIEATGSLVVASQSTVVLCVETNPAQNGGVACDGRLVGRSLDESADAVVLVHAGREIDRVLYTGLPPFPAPVGHSLTLAPTAFSAAANDRGGNWCPAHDDDVLPGGDHGTPGLVNPPCSGAPRVNSIAPADGMDVGGFPVVVRGTGFLGATTVRLGAAPCIDWQVLSDSEIRCTTAPQLAGDVDVVVEKGADLGVLPGGYRYTGVYTPLITWASAGRRPDQPVHASAGQESPALYGEVRWAGVTGDGGSHAGIDGQLGWGPSGTHPRFTPGWSWEPADFERPYFENDEYRATVTIDRPGTYSYVFRFSADGGYNWEYGDREPGAADGFELTDMGTLVVE